MRRIDGVLVMAMGGLLAVAATAREPNGPLALPREFADYRTWSHLLKRPRAVPEELWILCRPPSAAEQDRARQETGPHAQYLVMVYATRAAAHTLASTPGSVAPGAIIAKEKLSRDGSASPEGVGVMVKHAGGEFEATGGWEFLYYPASGDPRNTHEHCAACHQRGQSRDYVLGDYRSQ